MSRRDTGASAGEGGAPADTVDAPRVTPHVTVLFFAQVRHAAGAAELRVQLSNDTTLIDLARRLEAERPGLVLRGCLCAVDETYAPPDRVIRGGETVAFLPPVSGG